MIAGPRFGPVVFSGFGIAKVFWESGMLRHKYLRAQTLELKNSTIGSARQSSNIRSPRRVCTVAAGEVGCRVDSARRTNQKRALRTAQVLRGGSKNILPPYNRASGVHAAARALRARAGAACRGSESWGATRDGKIVVRRGGAWINLKLGR